jgi:hypothetical protein
LQTANPFSSKTRNGQTFGSLQQAPQRLQEPLRPFPIEPKDVKKRRNLAVQVLLDIGFFEKKAIL